MPALQGAEGAEGGEEPHHYDPQDCPQSDDTQRLLDAVDLADRLHAATPVAYLLQTLAGLLLGVGCWDSIVARPEIIITTLCSVLSERHRDADLMLLTHSTVVTFGFAGDATTCRVCEKPVTDQVSVKRRKGRVCFMKEQAQKEQAQNGLHP